ncbi:AMP-dependent synthetase/ligase [Desulforhopalus singaporensis]|uniref:Long-chain acyl-CoA synthetase n=1 Tax=Desulforhopalus singaporensis TaxID=91360 RepID=A0A1H0R041_9BACT|nr:long-chain fatty acid--CoA ligase [Desulforhopalus singaporensis]SDP22760.1 long-chain acyl-CoA synthetase [Desulforhopalus singaporensis]
MKEVVDYISPESCSTLPGLFLERVARSPEKTAYTYYDKNVQQWIDITWAKMQHMVARWRFALQHENLQPKDRVGVMLANSPHWVAYEQAALSLGLSVVPLYVNDRPENIGYILRDTSTKILLCPGDSYYSHLASELEQVPSLQRIITLDDCRYQKNKPQLACASTWLPPDSQILPKFTPEIEKIATIVYTSGTTGPPKGVMLSHTNILENCYNGLQCMDILPSDRFLSFLPLSHMLERTAGYYLPMMAGSSVAYCRSIVDLAEDLATVKPTVLVAVPRIFEKIYSGIQTKIASEPDIKQKLFHTAVECGWKSFLLSQGRGSWSSILLAKPLLDLLVGSKVRARLGNRLRVVITGGAPLSENISRFFIGLGLPLYQGYGLTETSPIVSVNRQDDNRPDGVGRPLPGVGVKIGENNELLVKGTCVMLGYWNNEQATAAAIDENGWLYTGDKAELSNGHIRITGRLKEILVLSNGEKVAPTDMELAISIDPLFETTMVVGEGRPYLTLLCVLNRHLWEELANKSGLSPAEESLKTPETKKIILNRIEKLLVNFPGYAFIKDVNLSLSPWTVEDGLLTPTLKVKRKVVEKRMEREIATMYQT